MNKKLYINDELVDIGEETFVALTLQINNIADLQSRQGNRTNEFNLPFTSINHKVLGYSNIVQSSSTKPYRKLSVKFVDNGIEIIKSGYCIIDKAEKNYKVTAYFDNADFFDLIDGMDMRDLDLSDMNHLWNLDNIVASFANTEDYIYPIINYNGNMDGAAASIDVRHLYPSFYTKTLVERIVDAIGWTFDISSIDDELWQTHITPFVNDSLNHTQDYRDAQKFKVYPDGTGSPPSTGSFGLTHSSGAFPTKGTDELNPIPFNDEITGDAFDNGDNFDETISKAVIQTPGKYSYNSVVNGKFTVNPPAGTLASQGFVTVTITVYIGASPWTTASEVIPHSFGQTDQEFSLTVSTAEYYLTAGQEVSVVLSFSTEFVFYDAFPSGTIITTNDGTVDWELYNTSYFMNDYGEVVEYGSMFNMSSLLPDISQKEFLKGIMNQFAISCDADGETKTLYLRSFREIEQNIPNAKNMTDRVLSKDVTLSYSIGDYGRTNKAVYQHDDVDLEALMESDYGDGGFAIDDEKLVAEKTVIELPFAATRSSVILTEQKEVPQIDTGTGISPRTLLLDVEDVGSAITFYDNIDTNHVISTGIPFCHFSSTSRDLNLDFDYLLLTYYAAIISSLERCKVLDILVKLNPLEIQNFDHFIPWYLEQYAAYFYVNVISNYKSGTKNSVQLIRI